MNELLRRLLFLPDQASTFARDVDQLHFFVILTTFAVSTAVGLTAIFFFILYRRRSETQTTPHIEPPVWMNVHVMLRGVRRSSLTSSHIAIAAAPIATTRMSPCALTEALSEVRAPRSRSFVPKPPVVERRPPESVTVTCLSLLQRR